VPARVHLFLVYGPVASTSGLPDLAPLRRGFFIRACDRWATKSRLPSGSSYFGGAFAGEVGMNIRPARIMMGATVFMMGILSGAGIAMWVMPPV
jgi:hypothetical protein